MEAENSNANDQNDAGQRSTNTRHNPTTLARSVQFSRRCLKIITRIFKMKIDSTSNVAICLASRAISIEFLRSSMSHIEG